MRVNLLLKHVLILKLVSTFTIKNLKGVFVNIN